MSGGPRDTIWPLEAHTRAKHAILRKYLQAWFPIMTRYNARVIFLDGFAGPGEYQGGEPGSPIIALDTLISHRYPGMYSKEVLFLFIEKDPARRKHLVALLEKREATDTSPDGIRWEVYEGTFDETMTDLLNELEQQSLRLAPTFAFIDPFGYSGTPMRTVSRLMHHEKCEVLINFAYENINRFLTAENPANQAHYDELFGTDAWRSLDVRSLPPDDRARRIHDLYQAQLSTMGGAAFVRSFSMRDIGNKTEYYLFFGTNSLTGLDKMKRAMWDADPFGSYQFSDYTNTDAPMLFQPQPQYGILRRMLEEHFRGHTPTVRQIEEYVVAQTPFHSGQFKTAVLKPLEAEGRIQPVPRQSRRRKFTFGDPAMPVRFL